MVATVIIGANFGDEGKGLITDFEARRLGAKYVVRFNGGAQAGHTVCADDNRRHVFGHVSSGTFAGAATYLGRRFIVNPMVLSKELETLKGHSAAPFVLVHPKAIVSTIYDMILNGTVEMFRGNLRHGSCGLGINETVTRNEHGYMLNVQDVLRMHTSWIATKLQEIRNEYMPRRMTELGLKSTDIPKAMYEVLENQDFEAHARELQHHARAISAVHELVPEKNETVVFEGAQGLMLDEHIGHFPYVTRSITGLPNALMTAFEMGLKEVQPIYVTRAYCTRHGAGPLSFQGSPFDTAGTRSVPDSTNVPNQWQGTLRYAPLNVSALRRFITLDLSRAEHIARLFNIKIVTPSLAVTCLDQIQGNVRVLSDDEYVWQYSPTDLPQYLADALHLKLSHSSWGPTASQVQCYLK